MAYIIATALFALALLLTGYITTNYIRGLHSFNIAGRELGIFAGFTGIVATGVAGQMIVMQSGLTVSFGFLASMSSTVPYGLGLFLYAYTVGPVIRRCGGQTLAEFMESRFSKEARLITSITQILGMMGVVALATVALANITQALLGWPWLVGITVFFSMYGLFIIFGGFWAVTTTDILELIIKVGIALPAVTIYLVIHYGGFGFLLDSWPHNFLTTGYAGGQMNIFSAVHPSYLTLGWMFFAITMGSSYYWMRGAAARDEKVLKITYIVGGLTIVFLAPIIYGIYGAYAAVLNPGAFQPLGKLSVDAAVGMLMKKLDTAVGVTLYVGLLAASLSTGAMALIGVTATLQRDVIKGTKWGNTVHGGRILIVLTLIGIWLLCFYPRAIVFLFSYVFAWFIPSFAAILFGFYWRRVTNAGIVWGITLSSLVMLVLQLGELTGILKTWHIAHPAIVGSIVVFAVIPVVSIFTRPKYFGELNWKVKPSETELLQPIPAGIGEPEREVMKAIRRGYVTLADIVDLFSDKASSEVNDIVERCDVNRLIAREALYGLGLFTFSLTDKGVKFLEPLSSEDEKLQTKGLDTMSIEMLRIADRDPKNYVDDFIKDGKTILGAQAVANRLVKLGYVKNKGIFQREIQITEKGREILGQIDKGSKNK
jgi:SSS family solute:Na+ symporter